MTDSSVTNGQKAIIGGGTKKILYTLKTVRKLGLINSAKALNSHNACKACGLGMGGQRGGMTNELNEFPSVCNKSIQAQSTDLQAPIPDDIFQHSIAEFAELSDHELEHLGRLNTPLFKEANGDKFSPLSWDDAMTLLTKRFAETAPERSFFYTSGRSSNEAGFILQLMARLYGTNNINNCSYYCHQATSEGLYSTLGTGTATVELADIGHADLIFIMGANPSSNHPRLMHQLKNCRERGGDVIIINPAKEAGLVRFAVPKSPKSMLSGGTWIASDYIQPKINGDLALFKGIAKALLETNRINHLFVDSHTEHFQAFSEDLKQTDWTDVIDACGISKEDIFLLAQRYAKADKVIFAWGMGITHHLNGVENVEAIANLALMRGMVGKSGAGLLPLRGHSNVQGIGSVGVKPALTNDIIRQLEKRFGVALPEQAGLDTLACLEAAWNHQIDAAMMMGGNLFSASPDTCWTREALDRIGFKAFLTTTLNRGHICGGEHGDVLILPVTARDEEWQPTTQESMFNYVRLSDGGIKRHSMTRPEVMILCELAERLLPGGPVDFSAFMQHDNIRAAIAAAIPGMSGLADINRTKEEFTVANRILHSPCFPTPNGKGRFCITPLPVTGLNKDFPWTLATIRSEGQFNSIIYEEQDSYRGTDTRWSVLMNKDDIKQLGKIAGDRVDIESPNGCMKQVKLFEFDLPRGNLMAYYPEANILTANTRDPRSKTPAFKSVAVRIV
jgi:molybdopterin-dependent oxidoreductase alpha subunit